MNSGARGLGLSFSKGGMLSVMTASFSIFDLAGAAQTRARKRLRLRNAQVPSFPSVSAGGAPNSHDLLTQSRAQTWRAHSPVSTSSTRLANSLPALGQPQLPAKGWCEAKTSALRKVARMLGGRLALFEQHKPARLPALGSRESKTWELHEALALRKQIATSRAERTSASQSACSVRGAVWPGRGIGPAERDEEGAGFRRPSSAATQRGHLVEPRASEGFAKAAAGHGRLTRSGHTTSKRSNEKQGIKQPEMPLARPAKHSRPLRKKLANNRGLTPMKEEPLHG